ncbi:unnamed protein product [Orchesella dallaii]
MTWFKEPSGAEDPHVNNKGSGMGANGSSHDGRLKSRSQSSSALYCIGKSGNGSIIEAHSNYGNQNHYSNGHSTTVNGLSNSIPADIWDLPCTAKSYSPISTAKQNRQNAGHYIQENYLLDSHLSSGGGGRPVDAETITTTGNNSTTSQLIGHPAGLAIGPNSSAAPTHANNVPLGHVSNRSGKKEKGSKKSGKSNNRAKLYAVSCPDVAEHTTHCGNLPPTHPPSHQQFDFTGDPRFIGINEAVAEELDTSCNSIATVAMTGSSFADVRPYPLVRSSGATATSAGINSNGASGRSNLNTNNHMAQSHPHLYASTSSANTVIVGGVAGVLGSSTSTTGMMMEACSECTANNMIGGGGPLFYSQQELVNYHQQQVQQQHLQNNSHHHQFQQQAHHHQPGISVGGRGGSSRSSHHSRSYQNLPCTASSSSSSAQQYGAGVSGSINQPFNVTSSNQQQPYNPQQKQSVHTSSTRSRKSISVGVGDTKCSQFQMPQFVAPEYVFEVRLIRDHRGLGLSVTGGLDSQETYPGLIRVKKVFPMGPAYESGELRPYDIILEANGVALSGLTNHEALEVLRTTPTETILAICRPPMNIPGFHDFSLSRSVDLSTTHHQSLSQPALNQLSQSGSMYQSQQLISSSGRHQGQTKPVKQTCVQCGGVQRHPPDKSSSSASASSLNPSVKSKSLSSLKIPPPQSQEPFGEFELTLEKVNGSLGFTLRQEDSSILGHYVRALVKDPALTDGRLRPGDRIVAVNGQDLSEMSHADAINFLRSCPPQVTLRMYRDVSPTPISPLSPTESHKSLKAKPLRKEAIDMLNDLAIRKQMNISGSSANLDPKHSLPGSVVGRTGLRGHRTLNQDVNGPATLPRRRLAHAGVTPSPEVLSAALSHFAGTAPMKSTKKTSQQDVPSTTTPPASNNSSSSGGSSGYRSSASRLTAPNNSSGSNYPTETRSSGSGESTPVGTITNKHGKKTDLYRNYSDLRSVLNLDEDADDGIFKGDEDVSPDGSSVLGRDESDSEQLTPKARKPSFRQFTLHLDKISSLEDDDSFTSDLQHHDSIVSEPGYGANLTDSEIGDGSNFKPGQPAYQSAILPSTTAGAKSRGKGSKFSKEALGSGFRIAGGDSPTALSDADIPSTLCAPGVKSSKMSQQTKEATKTSKTRTKEPSPSTSTSHSTSDSMNSGGLLKWKGVLFAQDDDVDEEGGESTEDLVDSGELDSSFRHPVGTSGGGTISSIESRLSINEDGEEQGNSGMYLSAKHPLPQRRSPDGREFRECDTEVVNINQCNGEQIFTVQLSRRWCSRLGFSLQGTEGNSYISAIYPDSVAAKDGRLRVGDELIMINGETVRGKSTAEVIDIMRKIRGVISITLHRKPSEEPQFDPKDHELGLT